MRDLGRPHAPLPWGLVSFVVSCLALAGGAFVILERFDETQRLVNVPQGAPRLTGVISDLEPLLDPVVPAGLAGREVNLRGVKVIAVPGDYVFWVGLSARKGVPVVLLGELTGSRAETAVQVRTGNRVTILGTVRRMPRNLDVITAAGFLDDTEKRRLSRNAIYIEATHVVPMGTWKVE